MQKTTFSLHWLLNIHGKAHVTHEKLKSTRTGWTAEVAQQILGSIKKVVEAESFNIVFFNNEIGVCLTLDAHTDRIKEINKQVNE